MSSKIPSGVISSSKSPISIPISKSGSPSSILSSSEVFKVGFGLGEGKAVGVDLAPPVAIGLASRPGFFPSSSFLSATSIVEALMPGNSISKDCA